MWRKAGFRNAKRKTDGAADEAVGYLCRIVVDDRCGRRQRRVSAQRADAACRSGDGSADERIFRARLLFAGDVMAHLPQLTAARRSDGTHDFFGQFRLVKPRFDAADLVVVNLETTLSAAAPHTGYPCFRTRRRWLEPCAGRVST